MALVELTRNAVDDLGTLIRTHSLPLDTRDRVRRSLEPLGAFPRVGQALWGGWLDYRFVLGPWRWILIVYEYVEPEDRVVVVAIHDARSSGAATATS
ncbi:MAG: type II toxin-antitoxin system RelE/ParE family toxin [Actinomycetota bacterium]